MYKHQNHSKASEKRKLPLLVYTVLCYHILSTTQPASVALWQEFKVYQIVCLFLNMVFLPWHTGDFLNTVHSWLLLRVQIPQIVSLDLDGLLLCCIRISHMLPVSCLGSQWSLLQPSLCQNFMSSTQPACLHLQLCETDEAIDSLILSYKQEQT